VQSLIPSNLATVATGLRELDEDLAAGAEVEMVERRRQVGELVAGVDRWLQRQPVNGAGEVFTTIVRAPCAMAICGPNRATPPAPWTTTVWPTRSPPRSTSANQAVSPAQGKVLVVAPFDFRSQTGVRVPLTVSGNL
jgi:hypothetical protein